MFTILCIRRKIKHIILYCIVSYCISLHVLRVDLIVINPEGFLEGLLSYINYIIMIEMYHIYVCLIKLDLIILLMRVSE